jgi:alkylation response protein AidB-like acyl-CoA dehydrogenase
MTSEDPRYARLRSWADVIASGGREAGAGTEESLEARAAALVAEMIGADDRTFFGAQFDRGLARVDFPQDHGGFGGDPRFQRVIDDVLEAAGRRGNWMRNPMGIGMCGPTIAASGTEAQRARFLRPIFTAEEIWCQLFSEPGAGSDVAGLATRAERDGDEWVISGQKVWTSLAHLADWGLLLARTDPDAPKHRGITAFIVRMHQPVIEIRRIRQMSGSAGFNEVFFNEARVPDELRVGEPGAGWRVANATLMNERVSIGGAVTSRGERTADVVAAWRNRAGVDAASRDRLSKVCVDDEVLRLSAVRSQHLREKGVPGPEGSILKLGSALAGQRLASLHVDVLGPAGMLCGYPTPAADDQDERSDDPVLRFVGSPSATIAGGTSEIMRNILGDRVLGLPREPGIDPATPWSEIPRS